MIAYSEVITSSIPAASNIDYPSSFAFYKRKTVGLKILQPTVLSHKRHSLILPRLQISQRYDKFHLHAILLLQSYLPDPLK